MEIFKIWIKAAVEKKILRIKYLSKKGEITTREVIPDYYGYSSNGRNFGLWACYDFFRREGPRVFQENNIQSIELYDEIDNPFQNCQDSRRNEILDKYEELRLEKYEWQDILPI